jgi:hypothetical protein
MNTQTGKTLLALVSALIRAIIAGDTTESENVLTSLRAIMNALTPLMAQMERSNAYALPTLVSALIEGLRGIAQSLRELDTVSVRHGIATLHGTITAIDCVVGATDAGLVSYTVTRMGDGWSVTGTTDRFLHEVLYNAADPAYADSISATCGECYQLRYECVGSTVNQLDRSLVKIDR